MQDTFAHLVSFLLISPLEAHLAEKLKAARAPQAIVMQVQACAKAAAPALLDRATADPLWAARTAVTVWIGSASPELVLVEAVPTCRAAVEAARPFLTGREA